MWQQALRLQLNVAPRVRHQRLAMARGSGLLDGLIALAILAFGMLTMTRFQGRMVAQTTDAQARQVATQMSSELLATVLVDTSNAACYTLPQSGTCANTAAKTRAADWATRVAASAIPVIGPAVGAAVDAISSHHPSRIGPFQGESETLQYLQLQRQIEQETRAFETASNVLKARHDATMNAIRNLRS